MRVTFEITSESAAIIASATNDVALAYRKRSRRPLAARQGEERAATSEPAAAEATLRALDTAHTTALPPSRIPRIVVAGAPS